MGLSTDHLQEHPACHVPCSPVPENAERIPFHLPGSNPSQPCFRSADCPWAWAHFLPGHSFLRCKVQGLLKTPTSGIKR